MPPIFIRLMKALSVLALLLGGSALSAGDPAWASAELKLGPTRQSNGSLTLPMGHAKLIHNGKWAPCLRGDKVVGYYLEGSGELEYVSAHADEWPVFAKSAKDWVQMEPEKVEGGRRLRLGFDRARILLGGAALPAWEGTPAAGMEETYAPFAGRWSKVDGYAPFHLLASQAGSAPGRPVAVLEMETKDKRYLYTFDIADGFEEKLERVMPERSGLSALKDWSYRILLSRQYAGWEPRKGHAPTRFQLTGLEVDLRTADNRNATVSVTQTLVPLQDGISVLPYEFISEIITEKDTRKVRVSKVTDGAGNPLEFAHDHDHLAVRLPAAAAKGAPLTLKFEYEGDFLLQPGGDNYWQLDVRGAWYPQPRHYSEESYLFHATVRTKGEWLAFMPGDTVRREKDGEWNLLETRTDKPICFATILGGKYKLQEETRDGLTVRIASYAFGAGSAGRVIKDQAFNVLAYYKQFLGPYPFKEFLIVEKNEWGMGQAPPGMMYITREAFEQVSNIVQMQELADAVGQFGGRLSFRTMDVRSVMAHEIAHQFWGTVVKMPTAEDQWLTESFADYCAALYLRDYKS